MNWKIQIDGDKKYIDDLIEVFQTLSFEPFICKEGENIYLQWKMFDDITDAKDISSKAKTLLTLLPVVFNFKTERAIEPLKIVEIFYEEGNIKYVYDSEGNFLGEAGDKEAVLQIHPMTHGTFIGSPDLTQTSKDGQILGGLTTIESIKDYLKTHNDSESLKNVAEYLKPSMEVLLKYSDDFSDDKINKGILEITTNYEDKKNTIRWVDLYKIYELIEKTEGGEEDLKNKNWASKSQIESFKYTANKFYRHSIFKIFGRQPKQRKMPLSEAEELISTLLSKYIEEKVKGGEL